MKTLECSSLFDKFDTASRSESPARRLGVLGSVINFFAYNNDCLSKEKAGAVDDILCHRFENGETRALIEMSVVLAPLMNAPSNIIHNLAFHSEIAVARPVLASSPVITTDRLIEIVKTKSQGHLLAVSERLHLDTAVTDALVDRGNKYVLYSVAGNSGACFSMRGFAVLVKASEGSDRIAEKVGLRLDLPTSLFRELLSKAKEEVRARILSDKSNVPSSINLFGGIK
ncbi:MAG TPA: DUF2336 domain-containing protein [Opitutaceae bacterium]|nr:DUF2336 domain-containing protein [Opitutaceae bacterium]